MATTTISPPASSPSPADGGMPLPNVHAVSKSRANKIAFGKQLLTSDFITVPLSLSIMIISKDPYKKSSDIYATPTALLPSRTGFGDYGFTSPRTGIGVIRDDNAERRLRRQQRASSTTHRHRRHRANYVEHWYWCTTPDGGLEYRLSYGGISLRRPLLLLARGFGQRL